MAKRITRKPLEVAPSAEVHHVSPSREYLLDMSEGEPIEVSYLRNLDDDEFIVRELRLHLRGQAASRSVANTILPYLRYVVSVQGAISSQSLRDYRVELDRDASIVLNTKAQKFGAALSFVRHLMAAGIIPSQTLPKNFSMEDVVHKKTFIDHCRYRLDEVTESISSDVSYWMSELNLKPAEAQSLAFGMGCMDALKRFAKDEIELYQQDCSFVDEIIGSLTEGEIQEYAALHPKQVIKSPQHVVKWLYANYGRAIPASDSVRQVMESWRKKPDGWSLTRVRGAFFPTTISLQPYFLLGLADERLCPNVDGLRSYMYLDCCAPALEKGYVDVFVGKRRGGAKPVALPKSDFTVRAFSSLANRIGELLPLVPGGKEHLKKECPELFVSYTPASGPACIVRKFDPSTSARLVRRAIKKAAERYAILNPLVELVTGENFRPTHAYLKKLSGKSIYQIQHDLHHKNSSTTRGYVEGVETQAVQLRRQQEFQRFLLDERSDGEMKRTGSGYFCASENEAQRDCSSLLSCIDCDAKRVIFSSPDLVAEWLAWERYLIQERPRLIYENNERWQSYWEPKLMEFQALISQTKSRLLHVASKKIDEVVLPWIS
ncbi:hypothetical protein [uncultured Pseudoteredinibacter sp.]|uniref:hypothetical protein n=1 Tax=uncultured Pseudoteredinibacter sp. TaxID=1641701 RepID=UPI0026183B3A|nr:hypothetical protein [uncultured Pseudoteredinibacter sp.]